METTNSDLYHIPINELVKALVESHQIFRIHDLPQIEAQLNYLKNNIVDGEKKFSSSLEDFKNFKEEFLSHMQEEESFLFPKIERTDLCLKNPDLYPEIFKGSINMFPPSQIRLPEEAFKEMIANLINKINSIAFKEEKAIIFKDILTILQAHSQRLNTHTSVETDILFPRALEMENELRNRQIKSLNEETE